MEKGAGKLSKEQANRILDDVSPEKCFWVNNGPVLKNMVELSQALKDMKAEAFRHHVNKDKNDFAMWVQDVVGDSTLAKKLSQVKSRSSALNAVNSRLKALKNIAGS